MASLGSWQAEREGCWEGRWGLGGPWNHLEDPVCCVHLAVPAGTPVSGYRSLFYTRSHVAYRPRMVFGYLYLRFVEAPGRCSALA